MTRYADARALILIVDDNETALEIYARYLALHGFRVRTARTGAEAIDQASADSPALVLMDLQMPGIDGTTAMRQIRLMPQLACVPILAVTEHVLDHQRQTALKAGFNAVVMKPCAPDELMRAVHRSLGGSARN